jgi:excisionase family DNA binding protein
MDSYNARVDIKGWTRVVPPVSVRGLRSGFGNGFWESEGTMAGKFLLLEEAARHLGVSADEVHRLVEKKRLFPLRDGTTLKFKIDELDRLAAEGVDPDEPVTDTLELDLDDVPSGAGGVSIDLADSVALPASQAQPDSLILGGSGSLAGDLDGDLGLGDAIGQGESIFATDQSGQDDLARTMLGTGAAVGGLDAMELDLDSIVGLSSPSVAAPSAAAKSGQPAASAKIGPPDSGTFNVELSGVDIGSQPSNATGSNATGSLVLGSGALGSDALGSAAVGSGVDLGGLSGSLINAGAALSGALDSGLSLEDDDAAVSGIDLGSLDESQAAEDGATALAGDEFELGGLSGDDDSASVVAVEPESGDSSFFATTGESSEFTGDIPLGSEAAGDMGDLAAGEVVPDTKFSVWQICGLVCCALLLLTGGFVMFDLMRTIGSPDDLSLSSPLLNPLASVFGWR